MKGPLALGYGWCIGGVNMTMSNLLSIKVNNVSQLCMNILGLEYRDKHTADYTCVYIAFTVGIYTPQEKVVAIRQAAHA